MAKREGTTPGNKGFVPDYPIPVAPLFAWPPRPREAFTFVFGIPGMLWPFYGLFTLIAVAEIAFLPPTLAQAATLNPSWIAAILAKYIASILLVSGSLHYILYVRRSQGTAFKYNPSWPRKNDRKFLFGDQVLDNAFWTVAGAAPIVTLFEALGWWLYANGHARVVTWGNEPVYCAVLFMLIPVWVQVHFWAVHRFLHIPMIYRWVHYLHHKNYNTNPWSGLSMHPIEHLLFFSGGLLFYIIPSNPLHALVYYNYLVIGTCIDHCGFHRLMISAKRGINLDFYMHYLHHKFVEVNYAADTTFPVDVWQGTFYDGTREGLEVVKRRRVQNAGQ